VRKRKEKENQQEKEQEKQTKTRTGGLGRDDYDGKVRTGELGCEG